MLFVRCSAQTYSGRRQQCPEPHIFAVTWRHDVLLRQLMAAACQRGFLQCRYMGLQELSAAVEAHVALIRAFTEQLLAAAAEGSLIGMLLTLEEQHRSVAGAMLLDTSATVSLPAVLRRFYRDNLDLYVSACGDGEDGMVSACACLLVSSAQCSSYTSSIARSASTVADIYMRVQTHACLPDSDKEK